MKSPVLSYLPRTRLLISMDAILCALFSGLLLITAPWLSDFTELPIALLRSAGIFLVAWTAYLVYVGKQSHISHGLLMSVVTVNLAWVVGSLWVIATNLVEQNGFGTAFVLFQALGVFLLAAGQYLRSRTLS